MLLILLSLEKGIFNKYEFKVCKHFLLVIYWSVDIIIFTSNIPVLKPKKNNKFSIMYLL